MRHAKSDWGADYDTDHERPLNERGRRSARLMGRLLKAIGLEPDHAISSTATRARHTVELAADAGRWSTTVVLEPGLYGRGPAHVLTVAATAPDVGSLMLVGHQPTWSVLVRQLTGESVDMRTASVAVVDLGAGAWSELPVARGRLVELHHPRSYYGSEWDDVPGSSP